MSASEHNSDRLPEMTIWPPKTGYSYIFGSPNSKFSMMTSSIKERSTTKNCKIGAQTSTLPFPVVGRCRNRPGSVSSRRAWSKIPDLPLELSSYLSQFQRYRYFRFWGHIAISGCRLILVLSFDTFCELALVENLRFEVCRRNCNDICLSVFF